MTNTQLKLLNIKLKTPTHSVIENLYNNDNLIALEIESGKKEILEPQVDQEKQIIVHCHYYNHGMADQIRIWETTYLIAKNNPYKSKLISAYNIAMYPNLLTTTPNVIHSFTLVFASLPKECKVFDLLEDIPEAGAFYINNIRRNKTDIYNLKINYY